MPCWHPLTCLGLEVHHPDPPSSRDILLVFLSSPGYLLIRSQDRIFNCVRPEARGKIRLLFLKKKFKCFRWGASAAAHCSHQHSLLLLFQWHLVLDFESRPSEVLEKGLLLGVGDRVENHCFRLGGQ